MSFLKDIKAELLQEAQVVRKHLERVPFEKADFQPHEKSEQLGRLAIHVAEIIGWWKACLEEDKLDFIDFEPKEISTVPALLEYFDTLLEAAIEALDNADPAILTKDWSMTYGDEVLFTLSKKEVLRKFCLNHLVHHRAQLGVYLRMLHVPVPAAYGPSADDEDVTLINPFIR